MHLHIFASYLLRFVITWFFLFALYEFVRDWKESVRQVSVVTPFAPRFFAVFTVLIILVFVLSIALGIYPQIGGLLMCIFALAGSFCHYRCASSLIGKAELSASASADDKKRFSMARWVGMQGHFNASQKNLVIAAIGFFIFVNGLHGFSLTHTIIVFD